jgi:ribosomal protein L15
MPLYKRVPKVGFTSGVEKPYVIMWRKLKRLQSFLKLLLRVSSRCISYKRE